MKKAKILISVMLSICLILGIENKVYAGNVGVDISRLSENRYLATGAGGEEDHSSVTYSVNGIPAYCIQAGIPIRSSFTYSSRGELTDARFSWIIYNVADYQVRQAAVWQLAGQVGYGSYVKNMDSDVQSALDQALNAINNQHDAVPATVWDDGGDFYFDGNYNAFVSPVIHIGNSFGTWLNGATGNAYLINMDGVNVGTSVGNGDYRIVIPVDGISGYMEVSLTVQGEGYKEVYGFPTIWGDGDGTHQLIITPNMKGTNGDNATSRAIPLNPHGNLVIEKKDNYGQFRSEATFHITGPGGTWDLTTDSNGVIRLDNILIGTYTITETQAPDKMINEEANRTVNVTVNAGATTTYTRTNGYPRGSVRFVKYDGEHRGATLGDATLEGAIYEFRAAENINEGVTPIYSQDQLIATVTTDVNGNTPAITNLPVGRYYYKEIQPSEGFNINPDILYTSVDYADQFTYTIGEKYNEAPEKPITGDLKIVKTLSATDYDSQIKLSGVQFKITSQKDPSQVYYTHGTDGGPLSTDDGICLKEGIPYGKYDVTEYVVNDAGYKVNDFILNVNGEQGTTYSFEIEDTSKDMKIEVNKKMVLREGEATDAKVSGAYFTVYRDEACTNRVCEIGPTDEDGYAISGTMRTGTYYMKETTFPIGVDPDAIIPGEDVTYRNKVYKIVEENVSQTSNSIIHNIKINNEPNRNHIEILKEVGETSNTSQFPLDKCEFTATLKSTIGTDHVFSRKCTAETRREDGYCIIEDLPYGTYVIEETKVSPITLKCANFEVFVQKDKKVKKIPYAPADGNFLATTLGETEGTTKNYSTSYEWVDDDGKLVDVPKVMQIKIRKVDYDRTDVNPVDFTQGDAQLNGAIYEIYRYDPETDGFTEYVYDIKVDHKDEEGYWCAESRELLVGDYMVKEKIKKTEVGKDGKTYDYSYAEGYLVDPDKYYFRQNPEEQTVRKTFHKDVSKEKVIRGSVKVIKYDNQKNNSSEDTNPSTEVGSKGAILRLVLNSSIPEDAKLEEGKETDYYMKGTIWYEVKIDGKGYGEFLDKNDEMHTTAVKTCYGNKYYDYKIEDIDGKYTYSCTIPYGDYTVIETKESDSSENTSFYVKPENVNIEKSTQIEYRIESDEPVPMYLKIQKRDKDTGATVAIEGATFKIWDVKNKKFVNQLSSEDAGFIDEFVTAEDGLLTTPEQLLAGEYILYEIKAPSEYYLEDELRLPKDPNDIGVIGKGGKHVVIDKTAMEIKENTISNTLDYFYTVDMSDRPLVTRLEIVKTGEMLTSVTSQTTKYGEQYTPVFEEKGLPGVTYEIYAAKDIKSPDGRITYVTNGTKVDRITTDENGIATTKELYPGEYRIIEAVTPEGFLIDTKIPNVMLESSHDELVRVKTTKVELENVRQKLEFTFEKEFEDVKYATEEDYMPEAVFGVYTNEIVRDYKGNTILSKDKLVDVITVNKENPNVRSNIDLPKGKYYTKELEVTYPYFVITDEKYFELVYTNHTDEFVVRSLEKAENKYDSATVMLVKVSTSGMEELVLKGNQIDKSNLDEQIKVLVNTLNKMTEEEVREYLKNNKIISSATFGIYTDPECTKSLYIKTDDGKYVKAECTTDKDGIIKFDKLPIEKYYLKELSAPNGYQLDKNPVEIELSQLEKNTIVYRAITNDSIVGSLISKTDIFTGEPVANCTFEIANAEGEVLLHSITDKKGKGFIPTDIFKNGEKYYFTEIEAPEIYNLNTDPHEFIAEVDSNGKWLAEPIKVENYRKESTITLTKLDVIDGTPIPNCKFELRSLETDFVVEGVTDEEGIYVFENIPYGKYTYTELEAPEEYLIDTTPHEITIDAEDIKIVAKDDRAPDTGDIAVIALACVAVISVVGIVFVILKNKKQRV